MQIINHEKQLDADILAATLLQNGEVLVLPTDTLYALSADACSYSAVEMIYKIKQRSKQKALPILVSSLQMAKEYVEFSPLANRIAEAFWPGALTIILPLKSNNCIAKNATTGGEVAVRHPDYDFTVNVIKKLGRPIAGTSANFSGGLELRSIDELKNNLGELVPAIFSSDHHIASDGSTIVRATSDKLELIRAGAISFKEIDAI
jgi:L-threonylcarbamoyladenylate synthase